VERVKWLRREARALRKIAERCKDQPEFYRQILELAQRYEDRANSFDVTIQPVGDRPQKSN